MLSSKAEHYVLDHKVWGTAVSTSRPEGDLACNLKTHTRTYAHILVHAESVAGLAMLSASGIMAFEARQKHRQKEGMIIIAGAYFIYFALLWQFC